MEANTSGWIAAYLEWAEAEAVAIGPAEPEAPAAADALDAGQTAAAYLEWTASACFGRRAGDVRALAAKVPTLELH